MGKLGRPKGSRGSKNEFADLDEEFKNDILSKGVDDIKKVVAKVALDQATLINARKEDQDLAEKAEIYKQANAIYADGSKFNKMRINFCRRVLTDMGKL